MSRGLNRIANRYPFVYFILAAVIVSNNIFQYAPAQVLSGIYFYVVPGIFVFLGVSTYIGKSMGMIKN